ncbi:Gfo/Idh/MocA family oxidoreductase [Caldifermentibacillus hisashii]
MMTEKVYNLGIVGYGGMGRYHAHYILKDHRQVKVYGVYDINPNRNKIGMEDGYKSYDSMDNLLNDKLINIVLIATPNDVHKEIAIKAIAAGKHVVCEKPVTIKSEELIEILDAVKNTDQVFMVHQNRRWDKDFLTIKNIYDNRKIGEVFHVESRVHGANGIPGDWRHLKEKGGGMLLDWGVHLLDQLLFMVNSNITSVYADLSYILGNEVDDGFQTIIAFENGVRALIEVGTTNFINLPRWYAKGTEGTAVVENWSNNGKIVIQNKDIVATAPKPIKAGQGFTKTMASPSEEATTTISLPEPIQLDELFYDNLVSVIENRKKPIVKNEEVLRVLKLMEIIFESAKKNEIIKVSL